MLQTLTEQNMALEEEKSGMQITHKNVLEEVASLQARELELVSRIETVQGDEQRMQSCVEQLKYV